MVIDVHSHITYAAFPEFHRILNRSPFTVDILLKRMDRENIDKSVLLPLINPECLDYYGAAGNQECVNAARKYPERLIVFCNVDPRSMMTHQDDELRQVLEIYKELGCEGVGEVCAGLPVDDSRYQRLFHYAGELGMPLVFHFKPADWPRYGAVDDLGLPRLERMLKMFPDTIFVGHSPCFWNEMNGDLTEEERPTALNRQIQKRGRLWELFGSYSNLYADLSGSAILALNNTPDAYEFLESFGKQLCFGTDRFSSEHEPIPEIGGYLRAARETGGISEETYENIMFKNFESIIRGL